MSLRALRALRSSACRSLLPRAAVAHPVPFSYLDLRLQPDAIDGTLVAHIFDVAHDLNIAPPERLLDPAVVVAAVAPRSRALLAPRLDGRPPTAGALTPQWSAPEVAAPIGSRCGSRVRYRARRQRRARSRSTRRCSRTIRSTRRSSTSTKARR